MPNTRETIEWLKSIKEKYIHGGDDAFDEKRRQAIDYAVSVLANGVTVQEWIPVSERLPENEQDVLVADNSFIAVWTFYGDYWEDSHGWWQEFDEVTHWMPLPPAPEDMK